VEQSLMTVDRNGRPWSTYQRPAVLIWKNNRPDYDPEMDRFVTDLIPATSSGNVIYAPTP
jgi:hypothetical protein